MEIFDLDNIVDFPFEGNPFEEEKKEVVPDEVKDVAVDDEPIAPVSEPAGDSPDVEKYYNLLKHYGFVDEEENLEDKSEDALFGVIEKSKEKFKVSLAQELWDTLPDDFKPLLQYGLTGGKDIDSYLKIVKDTPDFDVEDPNQAKQALRVLYSETTSFSKEKIENMISRLEKIGELESEATEAKDKLKDIRKEKLENLAKDSEKQRAEYLQKIEDQKKGFFDTVDKIPAFNQQRKTAIKDFLWKPIKNNDGSVETAFSKIQRTIFNNPEHMAQLVDMYLDYKPEVGFDNTKKISTEAAKTLKKKLDEITKGDSSGKTDNNKTPIGNDWMNHLK